MYKIDKKKWNICKLCSTTIQELAKIYGGSNIYYTKVFREHLKHDHNLTVEEYFGNAPDCACGICNQKCKISIKGSNFVWKKYVCGRHPGTLEWSKHAKVSRCGKNNPMYGKEVWNKGKTKYNNPTIKKIADGRKGMITSDITKQKQSESAKKRLIHGHTGHKHSQKTKDESRLRTLEMIQNGVFKQTKTKPHILMSEILSEIRIKYIEEHIVDCWSFDFFIPKYNIYIEVDGDYFHSNPRRWPNGPKSKTQKINYYRDQKKNKFCIDNNLNLHRFWEYDIIHNIEEVRCILKKLFQLSPLE